MKKILLLILIAGISFPAMAQKSKKSNKSNTTATPAPPMPKETPEERAMQMNSRSLGPMHQLLVQWSGLWHDEMKVWREEGGDFTPAVVERDGRMAADGHFLVSTIMGQMNNERYEAQSIMGYDNNKRVFTKVWFDNFGSSILVLEGIFDPNTNTIDFTGYTTNPVNKAPLKIHQVLKMKDPANQELTIFMEGKNGKEFKAIEVISRRN